jgi:putative endonuclease
MKDYSVYILTNDYGNVMYVGMTNDLERRIREHKSSLIPGFTKRYNVHKLVYFEQTSSAEAAIAREKQIKGWVRAKKNALVEKMNPQWTDLACHVEEGSFGLRPQDDRGRKIDGSGFYAAGAGCCPDADL